MQPLEQGSSFVIILPQLLPHPPKIIKKYKAIMIVSFRMLKRISCKAKERWSRIGVFSDSSVLFSTTSISGENNHGHHYDFVWLVSAMSVFSLFICFFFTTTTTMDCSVSTEYIFQKISQNQMKSHAGIYPAFLWEPGKVFLL